MQFLDLTYPIRDNFRYPVQLARVRAHERGDVFQSTRVELSCHTMTHTDAPVHFVAGGQTLDQLPLESWSGEALIVDLSSVGEREGIVSAQLEAKGSMTRAGDIVLLMTRWDERCSIDRPDFWVRSPYLTREAAEWLRERRVSVVGYDFPPDYAIRDEFESPGKVPVRHEQVTHDVFLPSGILVIEYLCNLGQIGRDRFNLICLPLALVGTDGAPARAIAVLE